MTLHHYIGANKELPLGTFGQKPTYKPLSELNIKTVDRKRKKPKTYQKEEPLIEVYETEEDFAGIHIAYVDPVYEAVRDKFTHPFVYDLGIIHSLRPLFLFIETELSKGETIEIYSCVDGLETKEKDDQLDVEIDLSKKRFGKHIDFKEIDELIDMFELEHLQYVLVKK
ncbi:MULTISPECIES: hypothetical protein [Bacillus]|uniref:hypothetical protein n=1 Tax=Bacillus TaxID=1386 RepID=UPI000D037457|nr:MULTISPECIES: hypothetical protein [Bacillus]MCK6165564.1 hypothetical protein [Bacillus pumilus]MCK6186070.1 hypothetical protein [Bacillus pumilus]MDG4729250.1 hypothetical protein [Bacillus pumilus]PRS35530.1 hypothetical protein C6Y02_17590 [Bacillus sp. NMCC4]PRS48663.1 hypothetical protein C6Y05_13325 [Bacillus sp. LNXM10]